MAAPPAPLVLAANGHSSSATSTIALLEEEPKVPGGVAIDSLVRPLVESVIEPAQLALPGLEAVVASQVEAEISSAVVPPAQVSVPTQSAAAPIETPVIAPASEPAKAAAPAVESVVVAPVNEIATASKPVESAVVASVTESTQIVTVSAPVEAPVESAVVAPVTQSAQIPVASAPVEAPVEPVAVEPVAESTQIPVASTPVEALVEPVAVAPVAESTQIPVASTPVEASVEYVVAAPVAESTQIPLVSAPVEASVESVVAAPVNESTQIPVTSAPVGAPVESAVVALVTESTQVPVPSAPVEAPVESVVAPPVTESTQVATASTPVEAPVESVVVAPVTESTQIPVASAPVEAPAESVVVAPASESPIVESTGVTATLTPTEAPTEAMQSTVLPEESLLIAPAVEHEQITAAPAEAAIPLVTPVESTIEPPVESDLSAALKLQAEAVLDGIALQAEVDHSGILAIRDSFWKPSKTSLLTAPLKLVTAPAPPDEHWRRTARPVILSRKPTEPKPALLSSGPQTSTLAGPCLPLELRTFIEDPSSAKARTQKRTGFPTWMVSVVVATFLFLGAGSLLQYVTGNRDAKAAAPASGQSSASAPGDRHPFAKFVEVTGLRVIADQNHKSQLQYIVVNHSSAQISGMAIRIAVRSAAGSSETPPLFVVSASVPSLAPYQSKEIRTGLDAELRYSAIPDWENLRADVQVNTQE